MPTTAYTDGSFVYPSQHGARQVSLPLIHEQEYYCTQTIRQMQQLQQFWEPSLYNRTTYTNVLSYSDEASNTAWTKLAVTVAAESDTDPEGGSTASFIAETTANSAHSISQAATGTGGVTFGFFLKSSQRTFARLRINNATNGNLAIAIFNLTTGVVESGTGTIKKMPGNWFYCTVSGTATVSTNTCYLELASNATTTSYAGTSGAGIYCWRGNAVFASSVSPTPATTATTPAIYTGPGEVIATVPLVDADDPISFLVDESPPDQSTLELGVAQWQRTFCRVSKQTEVPSSIIVSKPAPLGSGDKILGTNVFFNQPETSYSTYDIYDVHDVDQDFGAPDFSITGGTYTITAGAYTTASIAYNATAGDVQSALNLLPSVVSAGLATVTGTATTGRGFTILFGQGATYGNFVWNTGSLTPPKMFVVQGGGGAVVISTQPYRIYETVGVGSSYQVPITGGTYSFTYEGVTSSTLSYAATAGPISTALNALSTIQDDGGVTLFDGPLGANGLRTDGEINLSFYFSAPTLTGNAGSLEPPPASIIVEQEPNTYGKTQYLRLSPGNGVRYINSTAHGISTGDTIFVQASTIVTPSTAYSSTYYVPVTNFVVTDENNLYFNGTPLDGYMTAATITKVGRRTFIGYSPGPQNVRCRKVTDYYLPGFTPQIASFSDIPLPASENDGEPFFEALIAGGDINYVVGELGIWRGPILYQQKTLVNSRDLGTYVPAQLSPSQISGLSLWFDASQITGLTDGANVSTWTSVSYSGSVTKVLAGAGAGVPDYETDVQNGLPGIRIGQSPSRYFNQYTGSLTIQTVIVVAKHLGASFGATAGNWVGSGLLDDGAAPRAWLSGKNSSGVLAERPGYTIRVNGVLTTAAVFGDVAIYESTRDTSGSEIFLIGDNFGNTPESYLFEVICYDRELTEAERISLNEHLSVKWGIDI